MRRVYQTHNSSGLKLFCFAFLALSLFFCFAAIRGIYAGTNTWIDLAISLAIVCVGAGTATYARTIRVVLTDEFISRESAFRKQAIRLDQIRGRREFEEYEDHPDGGTTVRYLELVARSEIHSLKIPKDDFDFDQTFWERILRIPDLQ